MAHRDFRKFLESLEKAGELVRVKEEVDWDEEIGAIFQELAVQGGPAPLFENIKGYKNTHGRKVTMHNEDTMRRVCIALGVNEKTPRKELIKLWRERSKKPIKPTLVSNGPCKEIIHKGKDVNLLEFPVPKLHPKDGGRYILTWSTIITKDPDSDWTNLGTYRGMVLDKNSIGMLYVPYQHWGNHGEKYRKMNKPMPMAVAIGVDPVIMFLSTTQCPFNLTEYDVAGGIRLEPVELVKAETVDIAVPAGAEIVLEGEMSFDPLTFRMEGPFGERPGHYGTLRGEPRPVFKVKCITHRKDPILTVSPPGMSPDVAPELKETWDQAYSYMGFVGAAWIMDHLEACGVRGVVDVANTGTGGDMNIISIEQEYYGHARQVAAAMFTLLQRSKYVIVVDSDIDVTDLKKVMVAIGNRSRGGKSIITFPECSGNTLDPSVLPEDKKKYGHASSWDRVLIDATWPYAWEPREEWGGLKYPPPCRANPSMIKKVQNKWKKYGFGSLK